MASLSSRISFSTLCQIFEAISTSRGAQRTQILKKFLEDLRKKGQELQIQNPTASTSFFPILRIFLVKLDKARGPNGFKQKTLAALFVRIFCLGKTSTDAKKLLNYREPIKSLTTNDFAERVHLVLKSKLSKTGSLSLNDVDKFLDNISSQFAAHKKQDDEFTSITNKCTALELKWLIRIILRDLKLSLGSKTIFDSYHSDADRLYAEKADLKYICETLVNPKVKIDRAVSNLNIFSPFKPMLLERLSITDIKKLFIHNKHQEFIIQTKFDGERSQVHMKNGSFRYFTRHGLEITNNPSYGECRGSHGFLTNKIANLLSPECKSIILDGEMMGWHKEKKELSTKGVAFDVKKLTVNSKHQPCLIAFDILLYNDEILTDKPLEYRLKILDNAFQESSGILLRSKNEKVNTVEEILAAFNKSSDNYEEGIVLKQIDSKYRVNMREGSGCYKIKAEYSGKLIEDIDLVIIGGYYGEGRFSGLFNSFLMAAVDKSDEEAVFYSVTAVSNGLTDEDVRKLNGKFANYWTKIKPNIVEASNRDRPDVWIHPKNSLVLQVRASEMLQCRNQPAGFTLRFPRIEKIREDKPWSDACTLNELRSLVRRRGVVQKLTKRHATTDDLEEVPVKVRKERNSERIVKIDEKFFGVNAYDVVTISRLFEGKEICVLNGEIERRTESQEGHEKKLLKSEIETIVLQHKAIFTQNPGKDTFCVIVGNSEWMKARNMARSNKYDVVKLNWLIRATRKENWGAVVKFKPWEMVGMKEKTFEMLYNEFDEYWDSYEEEIDREALLRSLKKIEVVGDNNKMRLTRQKIEKLEKALFQGGIPHFLLLKHCVGYFLEENDVRKFAFQFLNGEIREEIDNDVTDIFVGEKDVDLIELYRKINEASRGDIAVVRSQWIHQCFYQKKLVDKKEFLVT